MSRRIIGSVSGFGGKQVEREPFFSFTGITSPAPICRRDMRNGAARVFRQPKVAFDPAADATRQ